MWVCRVRGESAACPVCQDQRVHQESRDPQDQLEIKGLLVQSVFQVLMDLVEILVLMVLPGPTAPPVKTDSSVKEVLEETPVQKV